MFNTPRTIRWVFALTLSAAAPNGFSGLVAGAVIGLGVFWLGTRRAKGRVA